MILVHIAENSIWYSTFQKLTLIFNCCLCITIAVFINVVNTGTQNGNITDWIHWFKPIPSAALKCSYLHNNWLPDICLLDLSDLNWAQKQVLELWTSYCRIPCIFRKRKKKYSNMNLPQTITTVRGWDSLEQCTLTHLYICECIHNKRTQKSFQIKSLRS